jgi:hypothetical protein
LLARLPLEVLLDHRSAPMMRLRALRATPFPLALVLLSLCCCCYSVFLCLSRTSLGASVPAPDAPPIALVLGSWTSKAAHGVDVLATLTRVFGMRPELATDDTPEYVLGLVRRLSASDAAADARYIPLTTSESISLAHACETSGLCTYCSSATVQLAADKFRFNDFLVRNFRKLSIVTYHDEASIEYPAIVKPNTLSNGQFTSLVRDAAQLERAKLLIRNHDPALGYSVQRAILTPYLYALHFAALRGELVHSYCLRYTLTETVKTLHEYSERPMQWPEAVSPDLCQAERVFAPIVRALGYSGIGNFDFKYDVAGDVRILELNPRPGMSLVYNHELFADVICRLQFRGRGRIVNGRCTRVA